MRIIAGKFRGRTLSTLGNGDPAAHLRPTSDRVREALFSVLSGGRIGVDLDGACVLDLFAGTGALGLEALSRGAAQVTFVENGRKALALLERNIALCHAEAATTILRRDATRLGPHDGPPHDIVFLDPPYGKNLGGKALSAARAGGWLAPAATIIWEESAEMPAPQGFTLIEARKYGETRVSIMQATA